MTEEEILKALITMVGTRINNIKREWGNEPPDEAKWDIVRFNECRDWLIDEARNRHMDVAQYYVKENVGPND